MVNKEELGRLLGPVVGGNQAGREVVDLIFDTIAEAVASGEKVMITGMGTFQRMVRAELRVRHPGTGEVQTYPARYYPHFSASGLWRERVAAGEPGSAKPLPRGRSANLVRDRQRAEQAAARRAAGRG